MLIEPRAVGRHRRFALTARGCDPDEMSPGDLSRGVVAEPGLRLIYAIGQFHTVLRAELTRRLREEDLTVPEFTALSVLSGRTGLSNAQLARRSFVTPQAMNQVLASLEAKGLVVRPPAPGGDGHGHHRARTATLTPAGRGSVRRAERLIDEIEDAAFATLDPGERDAFARLLRDGTRQLLDP
jgi:DNA-binding MarR family transcriptional regulator